MRPPLRLSPDSWPYRYTYDLHQALRPSWASVANKLYTAESTPFGGTYFQHLRRQHRHYTATAILHPCTPFVNDSLNKGLTFKTYSLSWSFSSQSLISKLLQDRRIWRSHKSMITDPDPRWSNVNVGSKYNCLLMFGLVSLFNGISTFVGYQIPTPFS